MALYFQTALEPGAGSGALPRAGKTKAASEVRYAATMPKLATWLEENLPQGLTVLSFPSAHHRRLRTSNGLERANQELRRRTRVIRLFPNEASLLRLVSSLLVEVSDDWENENHYLNMETPTQLSVL